MQAVMDTCICSIVLLLILIVWWVPAENNYNGGHIAPINHHLAVFRQLAALSLEYFIGPWTFELSCKSANWEPLEAINLLTYGDVLQIIFSASEQENIFKAPKSSG